MSNDENTDLLLGTWRATDLLLSQSVDSQKMRALSTDSMEVLN
jgi:hypothetical protein